MTHTNLIYGYALMRIEELGKDHRDPMVIKVCRELLEESVISTDPVELQELLSNIGYGVKIIDNPDSDMVEYTIYNNNSGISSE